jgi:hypothetical protein
MLTLISRGIMRFFVESLTMRATTVSLRQLGVFFRVDLREKIKPIEI